MIFLKIAGGVVAVVIMFFVIAFLKMCWYSVPYSEWVKYERERERRRRKRRK